MVEAVGEPNTSALGTTDAETVDDRDLKLLRGHVGRERDDDDEERLRLIWGRE